MPPSQLAGGWHVLGPDLLSLPTDLTDRGALSHPSLEYALPPSALFIFSNNLE